ncbi:MAG TPA: biopolymer transporter ExbD [Tepidisphaeraceae bacterium]|jgi:biopolymer transport protein ExbD
MKLRRGMPQSVVGHVNVTPLIDIMLVLIVFFMLVARIGVTTGAEPMELPATIRGIRLQNMNNTLTLNVHATPTGPIATTLINGQRQQFNIGEHAPVPRLIDTLKFLRFGSPSDPHDNLQFKVIIRADKQMPYADLQPVLKACADAQIANVNFSTTHQ